MGLWRGIFCQRCENGGGTLLQICVKWHNCGVTFFAGGRRGQVCPRAITYYFSAASLVSQNYLSAVSLVIAKTTFLQSASGKTTFQLSNLSAKTTFLLLASFKTIFQRQSTLFTISQNFSVSAKATFHMSVKWSQTSVLACICYFSVHSCSQYPSCNQTGFHHS